MNTIEETEWTWAMPGSCSTCLMVECTCNTSIQSQITSTTYFDDDSNIPDDDDSDQDLPESQVSVAAVHKHTTDIFIPYKPNTRSIGLFKSLKEQFPGESDRKIAERRKNIQQRCREIMYEHNPDPQDYDYFASGSKTKRKKPTLTYKRYSLVTVVESSLEKHVLPVRMNQHEKFMRELKLWASRKPDDTDVVLSIALEKYSEVLISHPNKLNAWYMTACKNAYTDELRKRQAQKRSHETGAVSIEANEEIQVGVYDHYPSDTESWFAALSSRQQSGLIEAVQYINENHPDDDLSIRVPESIKRKIRGIDVPQSLTHSTTYFGSSFNIKADRQKEKQVFEDSCSDVEISEMSEYDVLKFQGRERRLNQYEKEGGMTIEGKTEI
ncbi:hypothetical protein [Rhodococcus sp. NPDC060176]|uniref:hypothetical protein n=1 Tax=Rhodococcus sp. NPDC060176 TaxID=3347062 RepID=UPI00364D7CE4